MAGVPAGLICGWPSTEDSIPPGWSRVPSLDGKYLRGAAVAGGSGGAATHAHASTSLHSHTITDHWHPCSGATDSAGGASVPATLPGTGWLYTLAPAAHTHTASGGGPMGAATNTAGIPYRSVSNDASHLKLIWIESEGTTDIPPGALVWGETIPDGWSKAAVGRYLRGADTGQPGGATYDAPAAHSHTPGAHTHTVDHAGYGATDTINMAERRVDDDESANLTVWEFVIVGRAYHEHEMTWAASTATVSAPSPALPDTSSTSTVAPPYVKQYVLSHDGAIPKLFRGAILGYLGDVAALGPHWRLCDGTDGTPDLHANQLLVGADSDGELRETGGSTSSHTHTLPDHTHPDCNHDHSFSIDSQPGRGVQSGPAAAMELHTHGLGTLTCDPVSVAISSTAAAPPLQSSMPAFTNVRFVQFWPKPKISEKLNMYGQCARVWDVEATGLVMFELLDVPESKGGAWSTPISPLPAGAYGADIEWVADGRLHIAYMGGAGTVAHAYSCDDGETWM